jgi:glutamyl-tRNA synthetase
MKRSQKTRLAPTPSGYLHLGNVLSFALTSALARRTGASILLRIDDLDRDRVEREYVEDIFETLHFLGIPWDEGPATIAEFEQEWSQVHRMNLYREALKELREKGRLFACDCSRSKIIRENPDGAYPGTCRDRRIDLDTEGCNWRIRTGGAGGMEGAGGMDGADGAEGTGGAAGTRLPLEMMDFVVRKKDGYPAYQLTSVVDDLHFGVDLVVRGDDLRASTAAQQWLAKEMGRPEFRRIHFYHHPLLTGADHEKLSKSAGAGSVQYLRRQGLQPADIYAMILQQLGSDATAATWEDLVTVSGLLDRRP